MTVSLPIRGMSLSSSTPAVIVPVMSAHLEAVAGDTRAAVAAGAEIVEWRVDSLQERPGGPRPEPREVARTARDLRGILGEVPLLLTVRTVAEGGHGPDDGAYAELVACLIESSDADLVDIEYRRDGAAALVDAARNAGVPVVTSFHDFEGTPPAEEIERILADQERMGAAVAKIAVMPRSPADVATLLLATARRAARAEVPLLTMSMAEQGAVSRIAGHVFGSAATFGAVGRPSAPGQIHVERLRELMRGVTSASTPE
ncbi:type I 3-dehydroquinate dehydratase [Kocuria coralli]|nr:type I 3-dehydroquinate dehydratase [Kocuria coralli]